MLSQSEIASFYLDFPLPTPRGWRLSRKHFRAMLGDGRFVKLNRFTNRLNFTLSKFHGYPEPLESSLEMQGG